MSSGPFTKASDFKVGQYFIYQEQRKIGGLNPVCVCRVTRIREHPTYAAEGVDVIWCVAEDETHPRYADGRQEGVVHGSNYKHCREVPVEKLALYRLMGRI